MTLETITLSLVRVECSCGGVYAITEGHRRQCQIEGKSWTCPYCKTGWGYSGNSENARLLRQIEKEKAEKERVEQSLLHARGRIARIEASRSALRGVVTRTKKRIGAGVCPCCSRSFRQLAAHMKSKHPEYGGPS